MLLSCDLAPTPHLRLFDQFAAAILPSGCTGALYSGLEALARPLSGAPGDEVLVNSSEDQIVYLAEGASKLVAHAPPAREQVVAFHFSGDLLPLSARSAHAYSLCALTSCTLLVFPATRFLGAAQNEPVILQGVLRRVLTALHRSREKMVALGRKTAPERVAGFLVTMAERIGSPCGHGCTLHLPMTRRDIADNLGLTIETVSRQFGELRDLGLIETAGRSLVELRDVARLRQRAGHLAIPC